jgi:hypothetical protein
MNPIMQARNLDDLYISQGELVLKPKALLSRLIVTLWEGVSSFFYPSDQSLENKVIEALFFMRESGGDLNLISRKVDDFSLRYHFEVRKKAADPFQDLFEENIAKAQLSWIRKDIRFAGGANESAYFVLDPFNKEETIGVFKTEAIRGGWARFSLFVKSFFGQRYYLDQRPGGEAIAEESSHMLCHGIGVDITVASRFLCFGGAFGNFQQFARGACSSEEKSRWFNKGEYELGERLLFERYVVSDFLTGNLDAHRGNGLFEIGADGVLTKIFAIDKANTYPERAHQEGSFLSPPSHQYSWGLERIAQENFQEESLSWIRESTSFQAEKNILETLSHLTKRQKGLLRERIAVLRKHVQEGEFSPGDLYKYKYGGNAQRFLCANTPFS